MARSKIRADQAAADVPSDAKPRLADKAYQAILQGLFDRTIPAGVKLSQAWLIEPTARRLHKYFLLVRMDRLVTKPLAITTLREHLEILNAAMRRDPDAAEAALADHFRQALQRVLGVS